MNLAILNNATTTAAPADTGPKPFTAAGAAQFVKDFLSSYEGTDPYDAAHDAAARVFLDGLDDVDRHDQVLDGLDDVIRREVASRTARRKRTDAKEPRSVEYGPILPPDAEEPLSAKATDDQSVERLALGTRANKAFMRAGLETIGDLREWDRPWTDIKGIGKKTAEEIEAALDRYKDAPEQDDVVPEQDDAPAVSLDFEGLLIVSEDSDIHGLDGWKKVNAAQLFEGADDPFTIVTGLRIFAEYDRVVLVVPWETKYIEVAREFAEQYRVPCIT